MSISPFLLFRRSFPLFSQRPDLPDLVFFSYQRDTYNYDPVTRSFGKISYPCDESPTFATLQNRTGLESSDEISSITRDFGMNVFDIPIPTFAELFAEHAVAPFFVFQVFCVGLWCLDEYWYYSLFTLFMLIVFECTTVFQVGFSSSLLDEMLMVSATSVCERSESSEACRSSRILSSCVEWVSGSKCRPMRCFREISCPSVSLPSPPVTLD